LKSQIHISNAPVSAEFDLVLKSCLTRIYRWPVPFNWACTDWREEAAAQVQSAAWIAMGDYDASKGAEFSTFVQGRVMASVLTRYRQEWSYGAHRVSTVEDWETEDRTTEAFGRNADFVSLHRALAVLPESDRQLMVEYFWEERTQTEIALSRHTSQPAVSKRKRRILRSLYQRLDGAE